MKTSEQFDERKKTIENIKKSTLTSGLVKSLLTYELEEARDRYESISPASDFYRGQVAVLKSILRTLGDK